LLICVAHVLFFLFFEDLDNDGKLGSTWIIFIPVVLMSFAHTTFSTILVPVVNLYVKPSMISRVLSMQKICEGSIIAFIIYVNGHIR
jgi:hypothetical protein